MTLIKCSHCGHAVLSVATKCPTCNADMGPTFLGPEHSGELTECHTCGHAVRTRSRTCPQCGIANPGRHRAVSTLVLLLTVLIAAGALVIDRWPTTAASSGYVRLVPRPSEAPPPAPPDSSAATPDSIVASAKPVPIDAQEREPAAESTRLTRWTHLWTNVRRRPEENAPITRVLRPGTRVEGEPRRYGWWVIYVGGDSAGYVAGELLSSRTPEVGGRRSN